MHSEAASDVSDWLKEKKNNSCVQNLESERNQERFHETLDCLLDFRDATLMEDVWAPMKTITFTKGPLKTFDFTVFTIFTVSKALMMLQEIEELELDSCGVEGRSDCLGSSVYTLLVHVELDAGTSEHNTRNKDSWDTLVQQFVGYVLWDLLMFSGNSAKYTPVNLLAIVILSQGKCGLSTCTTNYLVAMATGDLLVIITEVILNRLRGYYFPQCFLDITPVCSVINVLLCAATDCSVWFTVTFSFDRFVAICCQTLKRKYCTERLSIMILTATGVLLFLRNIPFFFAIEPGEIIDNMAWFCYPKPAYYSEPGWKGFDLFDKFLTPLLPFLLILLLNALTIRHILVASQVRKGLRGQGKEVNHRDAEMESRRKSMILLFTISSNFILLWLVYVIDFVYYKVTGQKPMHYNDFQIAFQRVGYMLQTLSCCTNAFIYGATQSKFRQQEVLRAAQVGALGLGALAAAGETVARSRS
ncbi:probable G-protein coupled receptor 139 [Rhincodon typus]|uniref:probable G-protein coupled receptor 139 n=1 Tax=Rhincodon typus TaxID=259920 RepID=UPI00202EB747|nr:probable G-protein coupled receptor 139 [Rhincodon typus]